MFIVRLWNYFCGYAIIIVKGLKIERFINLAVISGIYLWDIEKLDYTTIKAKINIKDFSKLRQVVKKTDSRVKIKEKCGMPFKVKTIKKRKWFFLGLGALLIFLYILSSYVWMIEILGVKSVSEAVILENLSICGLKIGMNKSKIDKRNVENKMLITMPELTWIGIEIKGTKAYVTVSEKVPEPKPINKNEPCDIIASKNGVIDKILVLNGDGVVKDGDTVLKGQLLVTGIIKRHGMDIRYVHSMAKVHARTWYEDVEEISFKQIEYKSTGRTIKIYGLEMPRRKFQKYRSIPYEDFNKSIDEYFIFSFGSYVFPLKLVITSYSELKPIEKYYSVEEAKDRCFERLNEKIKLQLPEEASIIDKRIEYFINKESVIGKIYVEVMEDIGIKQKINEMN